MTESPHSLSAPYALDALDEVERARFEAHLDDCPDCREELFGFIETAARLGAAEAQPLTSDLRERILAQVVVTPQHRSITAPPKWRRRLSRGLVAAAMVLGVAGVGGYVVEHQRMEAERDRTAAISTVLGASDAETLTQEFDAGGQVRLVVSQEHDSAVVVATGLTAPDDDHVYQVWMVGSDGAHSEGTLTTEGTMVMDGVVDADSIAVTVEPPGGSDQPTTDPIATIPV